MRVGYLLSSAMSSVVRRARIAEWKQSEHSQASVESSESTRPACRMRMKLAEGG